MRGLRAVWGGALVRRNWGGLVVPHARTISRTFRVRRAVPPTPAIRPASDITDARAPLAASGDGVSPVLG